MNATRKVYVVDGLRTPFLKARGVPGPFSASDLATQAGRTLLLRQPFEPEELDEVILGCVVQESQEANIARVVAQRLGCGDHVPAWTVQRNCGSGMQALDSAARLIADGDADLILAGGVDAMSHAPLKFTERFAAWMGGLARARSLPQKLAALSRFRLSLLTPVISLLQGLTDPKSGLSMGQTAENLAHRFGVSRAAMDQFAADSHLRAAETRPALAVENVLLFDDKGRFYDADDGVRPDSTPEKLAKLRPVFDKPLGNITAGNSAQVTDGAALLLLASEEALERYNLKPLGVISAATWRGLDPEQMGLGPAYAIPALLAREQIDMQRVDLWEINEAFAAQALACVAALDDDDFCRSELGLERRFGHIDSERLNIDGGAISLGHPVGASGARIVLHLLNALKRRQERRGVAALCIGGGQGGAMMVERVV
ncbi:acetyl-CoA C-acetyltransferase [Magnetofaba australis]|uniref:Putative acetyl-CoA acetyltransferase n=1 Tax=Magnetofaba australis IT-1 TaxID=1434232 RepID=A0A1Y2K0D8_9PROT|nr:acetyl-CoA C-acetyltransferase [Magnetofaba australis]OSM00264.1 putative acetyl-CoA acetyltransferase [Magnetofaba australis IT-1]